MFKLHRTSEFIKQSMFRDWVTCLVSYKNCPEDDQGWVLVKDGDETIGIFPDRIGALQVKEALELQESWNEDHEREISR